MSHSQGLSNNSYPEPNHPIPRTDTNSCKVHSNVVLPSTPRLPEDLFPAYVPVKIVKAFLMHLPTYIFIYLYV